ncbi:MAG: zinc ribbon domain-containing protein [Deltaproteobacteria bacterium]|nr:zinc ribbon domain-containing protein [Deltaproteobacteria bacterium]
MPLYEYACSSCDHHFEQLRKFEEADSAQCPKCSGTVQRKLSRSAFHLQGGGWYKEGYSGGSSAPAESSSESAKPAGGCGGGCACAVN